MNYSKAPWALGKFHIQVPPACTCVMLRQCELLEYPVGLPPPVVLRLSELGLAVVAVEIREVGVGALDTIGSETNYP